MLTEENLGKDKRRAILSLKNGAQIEARDGKLYYGFLCSLLAEEPEVFRGLLAFAQDQNRAMLPGHRVRLMFLGGYLEPDGSIMPKVRDVLLSAYKETPDGPMLVNPFFLSRPEQARELERMETEGLDWLIRELRRKENTGKPPHEQKPDEDKGPPPGRG